MVWSPQATVGALVLPMLAIWAGPLLLERWDRREFGLTRKVT